MPKSWRLAAPGCPAGQDCQTPAIKFGCLAPARAGAGCKGSTEDGCTSVAPAPTRGGHAQSAGPDLEGVVMTVPYAVSDDSADEAEPLTVDAAYARSQQAALTSSVVGPVGLE